jgi:hypothetical protein
VIAEGPDLQPSEVVLEYRFIGSARVPALLIIETGTDLTVDPEPAGQGCDKHLKLDFGRVVYGKGAGTTEMSEETRTWLVCATAPGADLYVFSAFLSHGTLMIQIRAFPEAGISEEDFLRAIKSLE